MQTALEFYGVIDERDKRLVADVRSFLERLEDKGHPNSNGDHLWSCHAVCLATQAMFRPEGWRVAHGRFGETADHSWLLREKVVGKRGVVTTDNTILDVYPVASFGGPLLRDASGWSSPWPRLFIEDKSRFKDSQIKGWHDDATLILRVVGK